MIPCPGGFLPPGLFSNNHPAHARGIENLEIKNMALTKLSEIHDAEVVVRNPAKGYVLLELESGETAILLPSEMLNTGDRFEELAEGVIVKVKVIFVQDTMDPMKPRIKVSEFLDAELEMAESEEDDVSPATVSPVLIKRFPVGTRVKGRVEQVRRSELVIEIADGVLAILPFSELAGSKSGSFYRGVNVNARVLCVDSRGVKLTRREVASGGQAA